MLNSAYEDIKTIDYPGLVRIQAVPGNLMSLRENGVQPDRVDSHEFRITPENTFILVSYGYPRTLDLRAIGGTENNWALDGLFAEVDQNNNVIFNWSAIDHGISPTEQLPSWGSVGNTNHDSRKFPCSRCIFFIK